MTVSTDLNDLLRHTEAVRHLARRLVLDDDQADDVLQDACVAVMKRPPPKGVPLRAWLIGIVRNIAARRRRDASRRMTREAAQTPKASAPDAHEIAVRAETHRELVKAVLALREPYRTTMLLRFFDGLRPLEIAEQQGVPPATVSTHIHRGLAQLREQLDAAHDGRRASWFLALMPVAMRGSTGVAAATAPSLAAGALIMTTKTLVTWTLALALAALLVTQMIGSGEDEPATVRTSRDQGEPPLLAGRHDADESSRQPATDASAPQPSVDAVDRRRDLHGVVVDGAGQGIAGARVETFTQEWIGLRIYAGTTHPGERPGPACETETDGTFRIRLRRDTTTHVRVRAASYATAERFDCPCSLRALRGPVVSLRSLSP